MFPGIQPQPTVLNYNVEIPRCALDPPNANSAQTLIWYPTVGSPQVRTTTCDSGHVYKVGLMTRKQ